MSRKKVEDAEPVEREEAIHVKYRPANLGEVIGQKATVKSLEATLKAKSPSHCYLFAGPAGTGKTTLARIMATKFDCDVASMIEVDAASNSGIDDMRGVTSALRYKGFGDSPNKAIIIDECHGLSKQAWDSLLKSTEEPPPHVFFFFCSTNPGKVPAAMTTRCQTYNLSPVKYDDLMDLLEDICDRERYETSTAILEQVARASEGSPRAALTLLAKVHDCQDVAEASVLLQTPLDNKEVIDLCRLMVSGQLTWPKVCTTLKELGDIPAETIRIIVVNYLNACVMGAKGDKDAMRLLDMLACFLKPGNPSDKMAPLLVAFGLYVFP